MRQAVPAEKLRLIGAVRFTCGMHKDTPFKARINGDRCVLVLGDDVVTRIDNRS